MSCADFYPTPPPSGTQRDNSISSKSRCRVSSGSANHTIPTGTSITSPAATQKPVMVQVAGCPVERTLGVEIESYSPDLPVVALAIISSANA